MTIGLGIDTGGTYTDSVILDLSSGNVLSKAKALTTRENLVIGIQESLSSLNQSLFKEVGLVSLSSTLATNSIVEGKGGRVALILIGMESREKMPVEHLIEVEGGHYLNGSPQAVFDYKAVRAFVEKVKDDVEAFAVSALLSVRNPEHEISARDIIDELSGLPVVCGHELSSQLGFYERAVTAVLNARLIPTIKELMVAVKQVLHSADVNAPLMVVKGDGSFMSEAMALKRPIETVLSGPAASMVGARYLTGKDSAMPIDVGGTTTDIGILREGMPSVDDEGAMIGGWRTRVRAVDVMTSGIGGDSRVIVSKNDIRLSSLRVTPLCIGVPKYPGLMDALEEIERNPPRLKGRAYNPDKIPQLAEFIVLNKRTFKASLTEIDDRILNFLEKGPCNIFDLGLHTGFDPHNYSISHLEGMGLISRIGFTPTDAMHSLGLYVKYDSSASKTGARIQAKLLGITEEDFCNMVRSAAIDKIAESALMKLTADDSGLIPECKLATRFVDMASKGHKGKDFAMVLHLDKPIIGIGAPAGAYLPDVADRFRTSMPLPEHSEVGNAIGAIASSVVERLEMMIKPKKGLSASEDCPCMVFTLEGRKDFPTLSAAKDFSLDYVRSKVLEMALSAGANNPEAEISFEDEFGDFGYGNGKGLYIGTKVVATAMGKPDNGDSHTTEGSNV